MIRAEFTGRPFATSSRIAAITASFVHVRVSGGAQPAASNAAFHPPKCLRAPAATIG